LSILNGGYIESGTYSNANAGTVNIQAGSMSIDSAGTGDFSAGVFSSAFPGSTGNAGTLSVTVSGTLSLVNGGVITSSTSGSGAGGSIDVRARDVLLEGYQSNVPSQISAIAYSDSSGQPGSIAVTAGNSISLSNHAGLSIGNFASVPDAGVVSPTSLTISAPRISLDSLASITAASTGNVAASNIDIGFGSMFIVHDGIVTTAAQDGNGGQIQIRGAGPIVLQRSAVETSVFGLTGNGGDIAVSAPVLVMDSAFIQANTAAANASGGNVTIAVDALVPSGASLFRGGDQPYDFEPIYGFNVIQAAAPTGVSGAIDITSPVLDVASSITNVSAKVVDTGGVARTPCESSGGSSLAQTGRGGLPPSARGLLSAEGPEPPTPKRSAGGARTLASIACPR